MDVKPVTCLVLVDLQNGFLCPETKGLAERIFSLLEERAFDFVVGTRFENQPESLFVRQIGWDGLMDRESQALLPGIEKRCDRIFSKTGYTCMTPEFRSFLTEKGITELYFAGMDTEACVLKSAVDAFESGIPCRVFRDACASSMGTASHEAGLLVLKNLIGEQGLV